MAKEHWTQTPEGRARMAVISKLRHKAKKMKAAKKSKPVDMNGQPIKTTRQSKGTILIINGWRITLGKNTVSIDD